ncbi:MAG TPA: hypothetical protein DCW83_05640 [Saprospirales bacterium]|jgi:hypothetical protein|nr:hypothetical protein [Saprospirales bacterium]
MKLDPNKSIFEYKVRPIYQAMAVLAIIALVCGIAQLAIMAGWFSPKIYFPYVVTFSFLLFYALGNCLLSFAEDNQTKYWTESIISYVGLSTLGAGLAYLMSGLTIGEAASFKWIFFVFTFGYVILLTIMRSMRKIVKFAQREDSRLRGE